MIATGEQHCVRDFVTLAAPSSASRIEWRGAGRRGAGDRHAQRAATIVRVDPRYFRPTEVETLLGDATQGAREARLEAAKSASMQLVDEMVDADLQIARARRAGRARQASRPSTSHE